MTREAESPLTVTKEDGPRHGRYVARLGALDVEGEITFTQRDSGLVSADHTGVPDAMAGRGVAKALLDFMVEDARQSGFRIIPLCPFVAAQAEKHPEWADLFTGARGQKPRI